MTELPIAVPKTWPMFAAGSVLTRSTRRPASVKANAVAHAIDVLPTPPLPVKNRNRGASTRKWGVGMASATTRAAAARTVVGCGVRGGQGQQVDSGRSMSGSSTGGSSLACSRTACGHPRVGE